MSASRNHTSSLTASATETVHKNNDSEAPTAESIRLMKLMEGTLSKYDDPTAEKKVKELMEVMKGEDPTLTEDKAFLALYDHNYDLQATIKHMKQLKEQGTYNDDEDKWITVEKKKGSSTVVTDRQSQDGSAVGDQDIGVDNLPAHSPTAARYERPPHRGSGSARRGGYSNRGEDQRSYRRGGSSVNRRPFTGRGQRGSSRGQRGSYRGGRYNNSNSRQFVDNHYNKDQFESNEDSCFSPFDSPFFDSNVEDLLNINLLETRVFTRKISQTSNPTVTKNYSNVPRHSYVHTSSDFVPNTNNSSGSWADLASRRH
ncbi:hypothetical protein GJ496_000876 [Pomphorhynchus laevis]|nr:hypothetical protein GJ496_000876 [Pomphorhynchus laevis]